MKKPLSQHGIKLRQTVEEIIQCDPIEVTSVGFQPRQTTQKTYEPLSKKIVLTDNLFLDLQIQTQGFKRDTYHTINLKNQKNYSRQSSLSGFDPFFNNLDKNLNVDYQKPIIKLNPQDNIINNYAAQKFAKIDVKSPNSSMSKFSTQVQFRLTKSNSKFRPKTKSTIFTLGSSSVPDIDRGIKQLEKKIVEFTEEKQQILKSIDFLQQETQLDSEQLNLLYKELKIQPNNFSDKYFKLVGNSQNHTDNDLQDYKIKKNTLKSQRFDKKKILKLYRDDLRESAKRAFKQEPSKYSLEEEITPFQHRLQELSKKDELYHEDQTKNFQKLLQKKYLIRRQTMIKEVSSLTKEEIGLIQQQLDPILKQWVGENKIKLFNNQKSQEEEWAGFKNVFEQKIEKSSQVKKNIQQYMRKDILIKQIEKENPLLSLQNIPQMMYSHNFSRFEVHQLYALYKSLQMITSQRCQNYQVREGLDFDTFRTGIPQLFVQSMELTKAIFDIIDRNFSGFLNWGEFVALMSIIRAKTICDKIDLFVTVADEDGNGQLSFDEIVRLCKISLKRFIADSEDKEEFLLDLSNYFSKLIFEIMGKQLNQQINLNELKKAILEEKQGWQYLCLFTGADT